MFKRKVKEKATFFSPSDEWILPVASTIKREEREFVVDSSASMHVVSKKDLNSAELGTVKVSKKSPTTVVTVYVRELEIFVTDMLLEDTPAVLSLGNLCEEFGYKYH